MTFCDVIEGSVVMPAGSHLERIGPLVRPQGPRRRRALVALVSACLGVVLVVPAIATGAPNSHFAAGTPEAQTPLSTSTGVASEAWPDPVCPPIEGTVNHDPGVPPKSWASLIAQTLF